MELRPWLLVPGGTGRDSNGLVLNLDLKPVSAEIRVGTELVFDKLNQDLVDI